MSPPSSPDRSGRAPRVPPGPFAPPLPSGGADQSHNARFEFLPDAPMKRPPPDPEARVFVASEHTDAVLAAQAEVLRHHASSSLSRVNSDMREGAYVGAMLISEAGRKIVQLLSLGFRVIATGTRATVAGIARPLAAAASHTRTGALHARLTLSQGLTRFRDSGVRASVVAASVTKRGAGRAGLAVAVSSLVIWRSLCAGIVSFLRVAVPLTGRAVRHSIATVAQAVVFTWRWTTKILLGASLALLAVGLALAAIVIGLVGVSRSGLEVLLSAIRESRARFKATRTEVEPVSLHSPRAASLGTRFLAEIARLRVTVRWHSRSARPRVNAATAAFVDQIGRTFRLASQPTRAAMAVVVALIAVAAYGSFNLLYQPVSAPVAAKLPTGSSALAAVGPAPGNAEAIELLRTIKGRSIELLTPAAEGRPGRPVDPAGASIGSARVDAPVRQTDAMLGSLLIASAPKGANVSVDGIPQGQAPVSIRRLRAGNRLVRVELDGYRRWSWAVYVTPSRQTKVNVSLVPEHGTSPASAVTNTAAFAK